MYKKQNWIFIGILFISFIYLPTMCWGQAAAKSQEEILEERLSKVSSATKLDVHRFMGYEDLLPKYLSLPYDVSMNTNVKGPLFDIGYLLILFIPILLLFCIRENVFRIILMLLLTCFYCTTSITGYSAAKRITQSEVQKVASKELTKLSEEGDYLGIFKLTLFKITAVIGQPLLDAMNHISGKGDIVTYPFMLFLFLSLSFFFLKEYEALNYKKWFLFFFALVYVFYWWVLSAGIVYYGMLFFPLGFLLITLAYKQLKNTNKVIHFAFVGLTACWIISATSLRLANYAPEKNAESMLNIAPMAYGLGKADKATTTNLAYPNFNVVLEKINSDPTARVYKAGTFFHYFINSNDIRVLEDNQLDKIARLQQKYVFQGNQAVIDALKRSGYKYILVDLNLSNVDNSPEKNLQKKIMKFNDILGSSYVRLIGTDRIMENQSGKPVYTIYGTKMVNMGTFAAFEII